jgi:hypothetical protein
MTTIDGDINIPLTKDEEKEKKKLKSPKMAIIITLIMFIIIFGYFFWCDARMYANNNKYYNKGFTDGFGNGTIALAQQINEKGLIPIIYNNTIQNVPIQTLCEAIK